MKNEETQTQPYLPFTHRFGLNLELAEFYQQAEQGLTSKDCIKLLNRATKLEERLNTGKTVYTSTNRVD